MYSRDSDESDSWIFVSPPIAGWVLAVSTSWAYPVAADAESQSEYQHGIGRRFDVLFSRLMKKLDDLQFFGSHRVADFVTWARAVNSKTTRIFAWSGSDGEVLANFGEQTPEEAKLGFLNLSGLSPPDARDRIFAVAEEHNRPRRTRSSQADFREKRRWQSVEKRAAVPSLMKRM